MKRPVWAVEAAVAAEAANGGGSHRDLENAARFPQLPQPAPDPGLNKKRLEKVCGEEGLRKGLTSTV